MAFRAEDDDEARATIDDQDGSMRSDLKVLVDTDGKPLWDGKSPILERLGYLEHGLREDASSIQSAVEALVSDAPYM